ncbi:hypothetical protein [Eubacterium ventriosum]|uniref:hypothetical protein n=1 Tax=Eubacterium ventriosum TaxID=39496 RepID=UPI00265D7ED7|nr:hypothetical protein [Eubacterium ventriosum]
MTIRDMLETNSFIGDLKIVFRENKRLLKKMIIISPNADTSIKDITTRPYEIKLIKKKINRADIYDDEKYDTLVKKIPKELLELEVYDWNMRRAYRRGGWNLESMKELEVWINIANDVPAVNEDEQIEGQQQLSIGGY